MNEKPSYSLTDLTKYFLKLATQVLAGGCVGWLHAPRPGWKKKWITEEEYKEGLTLAQLAPGPLAAQFRNLFGFVHYGVWCNVGWI